MAKYEAYVYAGGDPVNKIDPTGKAGRLMGFSREQIILTAAVMITGAGIALHQWNVQGHNAQFVNGVRQYANSFALPPIFNRAFCKLMYAGCALTGVADLPGSVYGESRCLSC